MAVVTGHRCIYVDFCRSSSAVPPVDPVQTDSIICRECHAPNALDDCDFVRIVDLLTSDDGLRFVDRQRSRVEPLTQTSDANHTAIEIGDSRAEGATGEGNTLNKHSSH